jgi:hypothetical protein
MVCDSRRGYLFRSRRAVLAIKFSLRMPGPTHLKLEADGIIVRKDMSDLVLHNDEQLLRWPYRLGTSYEVALFHSSF